MTRDKSDLLPAPGDEHALYLIDVSSFIFRAYYSVGHLSTGDGTPTGAVFGVANMLTALFKERAPAHVAAAMDSRTTTFRKEIFPGYKANRPPPPDDLKVQFPFVRELIEAFDIAVLQCDGYEADDVIATATAVARAARMRVVIVSADKDLMQLVGPDVFMLDTMKDKVWDAEAVREKWGVPPALLGDLLAIAGDSSDNIPGVPRVGPKTAAPLLVEHDGLDGLLGSLDRLRSKALADRLARHADDARLSRRLVSLRDDVPLPVDLALTRHASPRRERLAPLLDRFELRQLKERLFGKDALEAPARKPEYRIVANEEGLLALAEDVRRAGRFAVDLETTSVDAVLAEIVGVAIACRPWEAAYIPVAHTRGVSLDLEGVLRVIGPLLTDPAIGVVAQNVKYEDTIFRRHGVFIENVVMDPMLASYLLRGDGAAHNLDALAADILKRPTVTYDDVTQKSAGGQLMFAEVPIARAAEYAGEDAEIALALADAMAPMIETAAMGSLLREVEIPLARVLCEMELAGIALDTAMLEGLSRAFAVELASLEDRAHVVAGVEFNLASPKQLQEILFGRLGLPPQKKIKTGYSTDFEVLETLATMHELPAVLLEHRLLSKLKSTYLDALPRLVNPKTGRVHTSFNQAVTATGRLSSSNPNLQNIPIRTERGRDIRRAFVAAPGHVLVSADYSQVELRILAHLSGDDALREAFRAGEDVHARTAMALFGHRDSSEVSREQRAQAKAVNFGVIYGKTDFSLAKELSIPRAAAKRFIDGYFELYRGVERYMDEVVARARRERGVTTMLGRRRELRDIDASNHVARQQAERMARNTPIQGSAADLLKLAMIAVDRRLRADAKGSRMLLTVHDELVLEVPESDAERVAALVRTEMEEAMPLDVPLVVDTGIGLNWANAH